jgi:D-glycero-D-manno-heptose 1,7-bisphosphate phosphatase
VTVPATGARAVFLDRDGTLIVDRNFIGDPEQVELLPGVADALRRLQDAGFALVIVTNQSGIGRGYFGEAEYQAVHARLVELLRRARGVTITAAYHCPHAPSGTECACRKPRPGLFLRARDDLGLDMARSVFIGDRWRDIAAAEHLGGRGILIPAPHTSADDLARARAEAEVATDLGAAASLVLGPAGR